MCATPSASLVVASISFIHHHDVPILLPISVENTPSLVLPNLLTYVICSASFTGLYFLYSCLVLSRPILLALRGWVRVNIADAEAMNYTLTLAELKERLAQVPSARGILASNHEFTASSHCYRPLQRAAVSRKDGVRT